MSPRRGVRDPIGRVRIIEHDFRPAAQAGEFTQRREQSPLGQIGRDAEPQHEGPLAGVESGALERPGHAPALEIVGDIGDMPRFGDPRLREPASLLGLRRRVIELEDLQVMGRLEPVGESVEPGAQHQNLPHAFFDRVGR